jgi:methyl-accepting chemotaxis protein
MINNIADSSQNQAEASEQIAKNIATIKQETNLSVENVDEVSTNSNELVKLTNHLASVVNSFKINNN